jgi:class 3 adenylate cyclase
MAKKTRRKRAAKRNSQPPVGEHFKRRTECRQAYGHTLLLGDFADSGRVPSITDVEAIVLFCDLRGFTKYVHSLQQDYQDNKVQFFLKDYFRIYPESVLQSHRLLEEDEAIAVRVRAEMRTLLTPTAYKNLGDGMMIVWECQGASALAVGNLTHYIYTTVIHLEANFAYFTQNLSPLELDSYSETASRLKMGFGLAKGHAWRLDFGKKLPWDYAGSVVNLAARLQDLARPEGLVAALNTSEYLFGKMARDGRGKIVNVKTLKGLDAREYRVWISEEVDPKQFAEANQIEVTAVDPPPARFSAEEEKRTADVDRQLDVRNR